MTHCGRRTVFQAYQTIRSAARSRRRPRRARPLAAHGPSGSGAGTGVRAGGLLPCAAVPPDAHPGRGQAASRARAPKHQRVRLSRPVLVAPRPPPARKHGQSSGQHQGQAPASRLSQVPPPPAHPHAARRHARAYACACAWPCVRRWWDRPRAAAAAGNVDGDTYIFLGLDTPEDWAARWDRPPCQTGATPRTRVRQPAGPRPAGHSRAIPRADPPPPPPRRRRRPAQGSAGRRRWQA